MFAGTVNPYEELVNKATDENLATADWDTNLQITDKVSEDTADGARDVVQALAKRLMHRNPNVQLYALELANALAQNCGKTVHAELSSRNWTQALTRLVLDKSTSPAVQKQALKYIHDWARQFEESGDPNLSLMGELYDKLRAQNLQFEEPDTAPEQNDEVRRRAEEEELARAIEISKRDKGGWGTAGRVGQGGAGSSSGGAGSSAQAQQQQSAPSYQQQQPQQPAYQPAYNQPPPAAAPAEAAPVDINTASRVRALYTFESTEFGELSFQRGDVIKVLDRGFKEWWRGAAHGKIGIFPVVYVEALPEPTAQELQEEAQRESRLFASLGMVEQLLSALKQVDPARGDRVEDHADIQELYQSSVALQPEITALLKKYSDHKAELEHMNQNFIRAMSQYDKLRRGVAPGQQQPPQPYGYQHTPQGSQDQYAQQPPPQDQYAQQHPQQQPPPAQDQYGQHPPYQQQPPQQQQQQQYPQSYEQHQEQPYPAQPPAFPTPTPAEAPHAQGPPAPGQHYYQQPTQHTGSQASLGRQPSGAPSYPPSSPPRQATNPGGAGVGAGPDTAAADHAAAWDAYYRARGEQPPVIPGGAPVVESPNLMGAPSGQLPQGQQPAQQQQQQQGAFPQYGGYGVDNVAAGMNRMTVGQ